MEDIEVRLNQPKGGFGCKKRKCEKVTAKRLGDVNPATKEIEKLIRYPLQKKRVTSRSMPLGLGGNNQARSTELPPSTDKQGGEWRGVFVRGHLGRGSQDLDRSGSREFLGVRRERPEILRKCRIAYVFVFLKRIQAPSPKLNIQVRIGKN